MSKVWSGCPEVDDWTGLLEIEDVSIGEQVDMVHLKQVPLEEDMMIIFGNVFKYGEGGFLSIKEVSMIIVGRQDGLPMVIVGPFKWAPLRDY